MPCFCSFSKPLIIGFLHNSHDQYTILLSRPFMIILQVVRTLFGFHLRDCMGISKYAPPSPPPSCIIELFSLFHNGLITKKCKFKLLYVVRSKGCGAKNAAGCPVPIFSYFSYFLSLFLFSPIFILKPPICPIFYLVKPKFVMKLKMELQLYEFLSQIYHKASSMLTLMF